MLNSCRIQSVNSRTVGKLLFFFLFASVLLIQDIGHATQSTPAAIVIAVRGGAQATDLQGLSRKLKVKSELFQNDQLTTAKNGRIQIMFTDNTIVSLGRKTSLLISEYILNKDQSGKLDTKVTEGVFRVMGGILTKTSPENFNTQTPSGNIGIRGSMYTGKVTGDQTSLLFEGGKGITFRNSTGLVEISKPGHGTNVNNINSMIPQPRKFSSNDLKSFQKEFTLRVTKDAGKSGHTGGSSFLLPAKFSPNDAQKLKAEVKDTLADNDEAGGEEKQQEEQSAEEQTQEMAELTAQVQDNPKEAARILQKAMANKNLKVEKAMEAVLRGMQNPTKDDFNQLINQALDMGITLESAKELVKTLKESGGICK